MYSGLISLSESGMLKRGVTDVPAKPYLRIQRAKNSVTLDFDMDFHESILLYCRRENETEFTFLAEAKQGPFVDERPNLTPYSETREYKAIFSIDGEPVGEADFLQIRTKGRFRFF
jgi:hypothetical protein